MATSDEQERMGQGGGARANGGSERRRLRRGSMGAGKPNVGELYDSLNAQLQEHPYRTVAMVAGVGFILGGGLFTRLAGSMIGTAVRLGIASAIAPMLDELASFGSEAEETSH